jgi:histone deacetylase complex regulatory component SIN3
MCAVHICPQAEAARAEESARLHREFMGMLRQVLDGHMDSSTFEDTCRALLGTNSYVLFTLDKLIQKFIKHMAVSAKWKSHIKIVPLACALLGLISDR